MQIQFLQWLKEKQPFFLKGLLVLLFVDVMIDPNNLIFNAKYVLFVLVFLVWFPVWYSEKGRIPVKLGFVVIFIGLFLPLYALSIGILNSTLHNMPLGKMVYFNSLFFFLLALVIASEKIDLTILFNRSSILIVVITMAMYAVLVLNPHLFGSVYNYFVLEKANAVYSIRNFGGITMLMIFYKTSPLLVFPFSYYLYRIFINKSKKALFTHYLLTVLTAIALFLSGTRANLLSLILIFIFYIGFAVYRKSKPWFVLLAGFGLVIFLMIFPTLWNILMNRHNASNIIKFGYFSSYADYFRGHLLSLIFGQGIGGRFFAYGLHQYMDVTELTYLELIRIWGIPIAAIFGVILLWPLVMQIKAKKLDHLFIAYLAYLFIAGTNPLLLSSTGMLVLVYVFTRSFQPSDLEKLGKTTRLFRVGFFKRHLK